MYVNLRASSMGNCLTLCSNSNEREALPIDTIFKLPSPLPPWPQGGGFGSGVIDLGGLQVCEITTFTKVWAVYEGGPSGLGATFFEPSSIPNGFSMFGCYCQSNNRALYGTILVGKDLNNDSSSRTIEKPLDYTLVWTSESLKIKQSSSCYIWLPTPPDGYKSLGHVITTSPNKPSVEKIRCVRSDFTVESETNEWIWGLGNESDPNVFSVYSLEPIKRGTKEVGVSLGTFLAQKSGDTPVSIHCLKNNSNSMLSSMPNLSQIKALFAAYSPLIYFHPKEIYFPSSVNWYFANGALLYQKRDESNFIPIETNGSNDDGNLIELPIGGDTGDELKGVPIKPNGINLPQGGSNDGEYWIDLPIDDSAKEKVKMGDLSSSEAYLHVKPMLGGTFTDIAVWVFYPFNGPSTAKLGLIDIKLGKIGEHVGDWEHLSLRISNFSGNLLSVYFSEHSKGTWVNASLLEFANGNKPVAYSSLNGHAFYSHPGLVLQGNGGVGIRNDTDKSEKIMDTGVRYEIVSADYLGVEGQIIEPPWVNYAREWGPKTNYEFADEVAKVEKLLIGDFKVAFEKLVNTLPKEVFGEEGPTGPKMKKNWDGDEALKV